MEARRMSTLVGAARRAVTATAAATMVLLCMFVGARPAYAVTTNTPEVDCTFAVNGHYRAFYRLTPGFLEQLGVPAGAVDQALGNLGAIVRDIPKDWNVQCAGGNTAPPSASNVGGHPSAADAYVACQMNTNAPSSDSSYNITTSLLQTLGVPPSAWSTVIQNLGQVATQVPAAWGISCTEVLPSSAAFESASLVRPTSTIGRSRSGKRTAAHRKSRSRRRVSRDRERSPAGRA